VTEADGPTPYSLDAPPIGDLLVSEVAGSLGDLAGKTLQCLTGVTIPDGGPTPLIQRVARAWKTPFDALTCEQLELLLSQDLGTSWVAPLACVVVARLPNAMVTFYPGDLAGTILREFPTVFAADPDGARAVLASDFTWIERLRETDAQFDTTSAEEMERVLHAARLLAA
jgi:hypothetical protein